MAIKLRKTYTVDAKIGSSLLRTNEVQRRSKTVIKINSLHIPIIITIEIISFSVSICV